MAKLRKYQVDAICSEIRSKFKKRKSKIKETEEFQTKNGEIASGYVEECGYGQLQSLKQRKEQLKQDLSEVKDQIKAIENVAEDVLDTKLGYRTDLGDLISKVAEKEALQEMGFSMPSSGEIENAIIVSDLDGADDIIEAVIEKLEG